MIGLLRVSLDVNEEHKRHLGRCFEDAVEVVRIVGIVQGVGRVVLMGEDRIERVEIEGFQGTCLGKRFDCVSHKEVTRAVENVCFDACASSGQRIIQRYSPLIIVVGMAWYRDNAVAEVCRVLG